MSQRRYARGFTAIELLVTLFVAGIFLVAGYQLYNLIIQDGGDTRAESGASNVAYDHLRRYAASSASNPCTTKSPLSNKAVTIEGAADAKVSISVTCPQPDAPAINHIVATVQYGIGSEAKSVQQATYVDASTGASPSAEITDGLIGWWQLNNSPNSSAGALHGNAPAGATSVAGQNGQANNAYSFNGAGYILVPLPDADLHPKAALTVSGWVRLSSTTLNLRQVVASSANAGGWALKLNANNESWCTGKFNFELLVGGSYKIACAETFNPTPSTWYFVVGTYDQTSAGTLRVYVNGSQQGTLTSAGTAVTYPPIRTTPLCIGAEAATTYCGESSIFTTGSIDDVRYYNRALSASEIQQLYNAGAK